MYIMDCAKCHMTLRIPEPHEGGFMDGEPVVCNNCGYEFILNVQNVPGAAKTNFVSVIIGVMRGRIAFKNAGKNIRAVMLGAGLVAFGVAAFVAGHIMGSGIFWALGLIFRKLFRSLGG